MALGRGGLVLGGSGFDPRPQAGVICVVGSGCLSFAGRHVNQVHNELSANSTICRGEGGE